MKDFIETDKQNNEIRCTKNKITLKLESKPYIINIGEFDSQDNYIKGKHKTLDPSKHKFKKADGWGVNYIVISKMEPDRYVIIHTLDGVFRINVLGVRSSMQCIMFSKAGYELQIIVPQKLWEKLK